MTDEGAARRWVDAYIQAWTSNDPDEIGALFAEDAWLRYEPHTPWLEGRDAIVQDWIKRKDEPDDWTFVWDVLAVAGDIAFIQGQASYTNPKPVDYSNLWVVRLDDEGRATEFTEWWMKHPDKS